MKKKIVFAVLALLMVAFVFLSGYNKLHSLNVKNQELESRISQLQKANKELAKEQEKLKKDKAYIEKIAREEMGLALDGEIIYKIDE